MQAIYVAPLKALARERLKDWREKFGKKKGMGVLELTGDLWTLAKFSPTCDPDVSFQSGLVCRAFFWLCDVDSDAHVPQTSSFLVCPPACFSCHDVLGGRSVLHTGPFFSSRHRGHVCIPCLSQEVAAPFRKFCRALGWSPA